MKTRISIYTVMIVIGILFIIYYSMGESGKISDGWTYSEMEFPISGDQIAVDNKDNIYVLTAYHTVQQYNHRGGFVKNFHPLFKGLREFVVIQLESGDTVVESPVRNKGPYIVKSEKGKFVKGDREYSLNVKFYRPGKVIVKENNKQSVLIEQSIFAFVQHPVIFVYIIVIYFLSELTSFFRRRKNKEGERPEK